MDTSTSSARSSVTARETAAEKSLEGVPAGSPVVSTPEHDMEMGTKDEKDSADSTLVTWDDLDPENPHNWKPAKKWAVTVVMALMTCVVTFASSVFSPASVPTAHEFDVSTEVMTLGTSIFVAGFAAGPLIFGPMSELYGRKVPLFIGFTIFIVFQIPVAVAQNLQTIMLCRFFGGLFGSAPLAIVGGALTDFWDPATRGIAMCAFASATFAGPTIAPIVGGFITISYLGWRWTAYVTLIMGAFFGVLGFLVIPETYQATLLKQRASKSRYKTKNWALHAKAEESRVDLNAIVLTYLLRPFILLMREPILLLVTLYMSLIYGIIYLCFVAYPISFQEQRGWNPGVGALPFLGVFIGVLAGTVSIAIITKISFIPKMKEGRGVVPEDRLPPMIVGGILLPIGLFWFAWTSNPHISWVPQVLSGLPIGAGILMIFLQGLNYIIDVYRPFANSALAGNTLVRSLVGAGFPMFAAPMYVRLGVPWGFSLLGFLSVAMVPVPVLFYVYGKKIREMSKYSPT